MVVPDIDKVTTIKEICEEDLKLLESVNSIDEHDHEHWAVDENGKEVDLYVYYDNPMPITTINNLNNFDNYDFIITDNIDTYDNIDAETEKNANVDDPIN